MIKYSGFNTIEITNDSTILNYIWWTVILLIYIQFTYNLSRDRPIKTFCLKYVNLLEGNIIL